ncbi:MAG: chromate transporter [Clostridia bacterium]|nr:chromate transporter [Clostridia bacterium]
MNTVIQLCLEFFLTGLFAIGGGMATLPFLYDIGARTGWYTNEDVLQMLAVSESTPGPIGVNMSTYVGFTVMFASYGIWGAIAGGILTTLSLVLPSLIIVLIVARVLDKFKNAAIVQSVFTAIRPASLALIVAAGLGIMASTLLCIPDGFTLSAVSDVQSFTGLFNFKGIILAAVLFFGMRFFKKLHPIVFIVISAVVGIIFSM